MTEEDRERGPLRKVVLRLRDGRQKLECGHWVRRSVNRRTERRCVLCARFGPLVSL
jgi:hypothetical protein